MSLSKIFLYVIYILFLSIRSVGQPYKLVKEICTQDTLLGDDYAINTLYNECNDEMCMIRNLGSNKSGYDLKVSIFKLETGAVVSSDTFIGLPQFFIPTEVCFNKNYVLISGFDYYLLFDRVKKEIYTYPQNAPTENYFLFRRRFNGCAIINDSTALLYGIYRFSPSSDTPGVHMYIFNLNSNKVEDSLSRPFPGIAMSGGVAANWLTVNNQKIYIITPLSGEIQVYNKKLRLEQSYEVPIFTSNELKENLTFEHKIDSVVNFENERIYRIRVNIPKDSLYFYRNRLSSPLDSKDFIMNTAEVATSKYTFAENISPFNDTLIAITIAKPEYKRKYRDLIIYDEKRKMIVKKYEKFQTEHSDTLNKPEDFFAIYIGGGCQRIHKYFHDNYIYSGNFYPTTLYKDGSYSSMSEAIFKYTAKHGYPWSILKYRLE